MLGAPPIGMWVAHAASHRPGGKYRVRIHDSVQRSMEPPRAPALRMHSDHRCNLPIYSRTLMITED